MIRHIALVALMAMPLLALGQSERQREDNLRTCLSGRFPNICNRAWLTPDERQRAEEAERRANLNSCLTGRFPTLCNRSRLTPAELAQTQEAEHRENLKTCLTGRFKNLCNKGLLTREELQQVLTAEKAENLRTCLIGRFPTLCDRSLLTPEQLSNATTAERHVQSTSPPIAARPRSRVRGSDCESGLWVSSVSSDGSIVRLSDASVWEIDVIDRIDTMLWLPTTDVIACHDRLINTDDNEVVNATRLR